MLILYPHKCTEILKAPTVAQCVCATAGAIVSVISVSSEDISCVNFIHDVVEDWIIAVGDDATAHILEFLQVVDDLRAKEGGSVLECWLVNNNSGSLGLDAFHDALDGRLPEVVGIRFHGQPVDTDNDVFQLAFLIVGVRFAATVCPGNIQYAFCDKVFSRTISLDDCFNKVFRYILIVGEQLLSIFGQAVTAVAKGRVVVVIADARIKADTLDDLSGVQPLDLCIGVQLVEVADAQRQIGVNCGR